MNPALTAQLSAIRSLQTDLHTRMADIDDRILRAERLAWQEIPEPAARVTLTSDTGILPVCSRRLPADPAGEHPAPRGLEGPSPEGRMPPATHRLEARCHAVAPRREEDDHALEIRVGTYWLVRVGMLLLLTGLVFLGNFAWHTWVPRMGAGGKLTALAVSGLGLALGGMFLHRGAAKRESLRNYSLVLLGGGLATLYYTAYGAHFIESLRVIPHPIAGGTLLLGMAALIVWAAEKWKSETVALLAVLLSFYTSAMNPIAEFSLFSNLLLAGTAIWFLARHDWAHLTYASLAGSYAAFGFWRVLQEGSVVWGSGLTESEFWISRGFLLTYWVLFTVAFCIGGGRKLPPTHRAIAITANNAAFFAYSGPALAQFYPGAFWILPSVLGVILIGLSRLSRRRDEAPLIESALLVQGLALLLLGMASKLTGYSLALCTAMEAALLLWFSGRDARQAGIYRLGAAACAVTATFVSWNLLIHWQGHLPGLAVAAVFLVMAWMNRRILRTPATEADPAAAGLGLVALINIGVVIVQQNWPAWGLTLAFTALAAAAFGAWRKLKMPEAAGAVHLLIIAAAVPGLNAALTGPFDAWPVMIAGFACLGMSLLWQRGMFSKALVAARWEWAFAGAGSALLLAAWGSCCSIEEWIAAGTGAAVVWALAGFALRSAAIGAWSQVALGSALICLANRFAPDTPGTAWLVLGGAAVCGFGAHAALQKQLVADGWQPAVCTLGAVWRVVTAVLLAGLLSPTVNDSLHVLLALQAAAWLIAGRHFRWAESASCGLIFAVLWFLCGCAVGVRGYHTGAILLSAVIMLATVQVVARHRREWLPGIEVRHAFSAAATVVFAAAITGWVRLKFGPAGLTAAWSVLGCCGFGLGLLLRDRAVRWTGLAVLGLALGRIFVVDVWQLSTAGRIVSFLALGGVLLAVGFVYNRFADRIARWL